MKAIVTLLAFLAVLALLVASNSRSVSYAIEAAVWFAFAIGSVVLVIKSLRSPKRGFYTGQLSALPRSWQRWILDQKDDRPK